MGAKSKIECIITYNINKITMNNNSNITNIILHGTIKVIELYDSRIYWIKTTDTQKFTAQIKFYDNSNNKSQLEKIEQSQFKTFIENTKFIQDTTLSRTTQQKDKNSSLSTSETEKQVNAGQSTNEKPQNNKKDNIGQKLIENKPTSHTNQISEISQTTSEQPIKDQQTSKNINVSPMEIQKPTVDSKQDSADIKNTSSSKAKTPVKTNQDTSKTNKTVNSNVFTKITNPNKDSLSPEAPILKSTNKTTHEMKPFPETNIKDTIDSKSITNNQKSIGNSLTSKTTEQYNRITYAKNESLNTNQQNHQNNKEHTITNLKQPNPVNDSDDKHQSASDTEQQVNSQQPNQENVVEPKKNNKLRNSLFTLGFLIFVAAIASLLKKYIIPSYKLKNEINTTPSELDVNTKDTSTDSTKLGELSNQSSNKPIETHVNTELPDEKSNDELIYEESNESIYEESSIYNQ